MTTQQIIDIDENFQEFISNAFSEKMTIISCDDYPAFAIIKLADKTNDDLIGNILDAIAQQFDVKEVVINSHTICDSDDTLEISATIKQDDEDTEITFNITHITTF